MHPNPRRVAPLVLVLALVAIVTWYLNGRGASAEEMQLSASGTIEATQVRISPELAGKVIAVEVAEGEAVQAGQILVEFDTALLQAQLAQAAGGLSALQASQAAADAALAAAGAAWAAARSNYDLLKAGPSRQQLEVAQSVVDMARVAADAAQEAYDDLAEGLRDTPNGKALKLQMDTAQASLANAQAQYDLNAAGARPEQLDAAGAQVEAAEAQVQAAQAQVEATRAQVESAAAAQQAIEIQIQKLTLTAPSSGVVLSRSVQPGEIATPGATLLVIGQLDRLTITVYVPEDRYGTIRLGEEAKVSVDSFLGVVFPARVTLIANQAEFTPRNVQTAEGRRTTVFAVKLAVEDPQGRLKPGMPADVLFEEDAE